MHTQGKGTVKLEGDSIYLKLIWESNSMGRMSYHSVVVSSWLITPETIGPRIIARPCPANPKETNLTPMYSVGIMVFFSGF